jgi:hypothetical protein
MLKQKVLLIHCAIITEFSQVQIAITTIPARQSITPHNAGIDSFSLNLIALYMKKSTIEIPTIIGYAIVPALLAARISKLKNVKNKTSKVAKLIISEDFRQLCPS